MKVPNQNNINEIIQANLDSTGLIIQTVANTISRIVNDKNTKLLEKNMGAFKSICGIASEYTNTVNDLINSFCNEIKQGKDVNDLMVRIEGYNDNKEVKIKQYTPIDTLYTLVNVVNSLSSMKTPNIIKLKINLFKTKLALETSLSTLINFINENVTKEKIDSIETLGELICGKDKKSGLLKVVEEMGSVFNKINEFNFSIKAYILFRLALHRLQKVVHKIIEFMNGDDISARADKGFSNKIKKAESCSAFFVGVPKRTRTAD